jgi:hypothetical protein
MIFWVAVVIGCTNPAAVSCDSLVRTEAFHSEVACTEEVQQVVDFLSSQGKAAKGRCVPVKAGEAA